MTELREDAEARDIQRKRTTVLLGAGASADAGLLLTSGLAQAIVERANSKAAWSHQSAKPDWVRALNAVYAGMVGYQGARGGNPLSAVNIETLISAVRLLRKRDDHEVAPFVAGWSSALSNFGSSNLPTRSGKEILTAIDKSLTSSHGMGDRDVTEAVAEIARAAVRPDLEKPFADAEDFVLRSLVELLGDHQDVSYFDPLFELARTQHGGVDVITLNYDLTIEAAAERNGMTVNRGVEAWRPGQSLDFAPTHEVINLMKVHGSLDWRIARAKTDLLPQLAPYIIKAVPVSKNDDDRPADLPWIVVGDREKLATDGPTLALNLAAQTALQRTTHLAVVGYSFGDEHINSMIRDWLAADETRTMSVLDLRWPRSREHGDVVDFRSALVASYGAQQRYDGNPLDPRVLPIEGSASTMLNHVLTTRPHRAPDPIAEAVVTREDSVVRVDITWHGAGLTRAEINAWPSQEKAPLAYGHSYIPLYNSVPSPALSPAEAWDLLSGRRDWSSGATVSVYAQPDVRFPLQLQVSGDSIHGRLRWSERVDG